MATSIPVLCGSMAANPYRLAVEVHNAAYRELGLDYTFVYFGITDAQAGVEAIRALGIRGMNVSMPYKSAVIPHLDRLDPAAEAIGAVNTIDNRDGILTGYNTDYIGAIRALEERIHLSGARVALLGSGGAARAVAYGLSQRGADTTIFNRSAERGKSLAADFGQNYGGTLDQFPGGDHFDILINSTAVGFQQAEQSPIAGGRLAKGTLVMDVVFLPPQTKLLQLAEAAGCRTIQGVRMLLHQACGQVELYTGCSAPVSVMEQVIERELRKMQSGG